jgi:hypothetical protein
MTMNAMLRPEPLRQLTLAIDGAVKKNPGLAGARQALMQPLNALAAFGQEAEAALRGEPPALERLRLLLQFAASSALQVRHAFGRTGDERGGDDARAAGGKRPKKPKEPPCEGGVVRLGALVVAALAAGRVGRRMSPSLACDMVDVVHGVALATSPAESLARSLGSGLTANQVAAALEGLSSPEALRTSVSMMAPMWLDGCERARWACLDYLFDIVKEQVEWDWEGSDSSLVSDVRRIERNGQPALRFQVDTDGAEASAGRAALHALKDDRAICVLSYGGRTLHARTASVSIKDAQVTVELPAEARAGQVAIAFRDKLAGIAELRKRARERWASEVRGPCLNEDELPLDSIFDETTEAALPAPPPQASATWGARILDATVVRNVAQAELRVSLARAADAHRVEAEVEGESARLSLEIQGSQARARLGERLKARELRGTARVFARGRKDPDDTRDFDETRDDGASADPPPAPGSGDGTGGEGSDGDDAPDSGPSSAPSNAERRVLLVVRPAIVKDKRLSRVAPGALDELQRFFGESALVEELPFVRDDDLVFEGSLTGLAGPDASALLERMAALAARSSGADDATLIALVPPETLSDPLDVVTAPADGAQAVTIAALEGLKRRFERVTAKVPASARADRLRVVGRIVRDDIQITEPVRLERARLAGTGAPFITPFVAVGMDDRGEVLTSARLCTTNSTRAGAFIALLPVSESVKSVEFRFQPETLAVELRAQPQTVVADIASFAAPVRSASIPGLANQSSPVVRLIGATRKPLPMLGRPSGSPRVEILAVDPSEVRWRASHDLGVRSAIELEAGRERADGVALWTRIEFPSLASDGAQASLPLSRPPTTGGVERLRVTASDGWNRDESVGALVVATAPLRIRVLDARRYWLEVRSPASTSVEWSLWDPEAFAATRTPPIGLTAVTTASTSSGPLRRASLSLAELFETSSEETGLVLVAEWQGSLDNVTLPAARR